MTNPAFDAQSLLAIDVGAVTTRAMLFDVVDGRYRFLAAGISPTTAGSPFCDTGEGIRRALMHLHEITGREFVDDSERLIIPSQEDGRGIDLCVATVSAGPPLKVVAVGLLEDISAESAQRLAKTIYAEVVDHFSLSDRRKAAARLDAIVRARPDVILVAGGTEGGASQSLLSQLESVGLACYLLPEKNRPEVLFAGNQALLDEVDQTISGLTTLSSAANIRPSLEVEQLEPASIQLARIYRRLRIARLPGLAELDAWAGERLMPTASAFGRIVRFLSKAYDPEKGVLGVDVGASATTLAAAFNGSLHLGVFPELGLGARVNELPNQGALADILRFAPNGMTEQDLRNYVANKALYPSSVPVNPEMMAVEMALARQAMHWAAAQMDPRFPASVARIRPGLLPLFEPIFVTGSVITAASSRGAGLLAVLDGLQPTGVTTIVLDQNNLLAALGAAADVSKVLPVQLLESSSFLNLGTVIAPVGNAPFGAPALRVRMKQAGGEESVFEVKHGALEVIPAAIGHKLELHIQPLNRFDVGMGGPGRGGGVRVTGGALGLIIDARGRPLRLPAEPDKRSQLFKKWTAALGG